MVLELFKVGQNNTVDERGYKNWFFGSCAFNFSLIQMYDTPKDAEFYQ
jgi:hypothetical protein